MKKYAKILIRKNGLKNGISYKIFCTCFNKLYYSDSSESYG